MPTEIKDIKSLKENLKVEEPVASENSIVEIQRILSPENRQVAVEKLDKILHESGLSFYEGLLAFTDLFNAVFITTLNEEMQSEESKEASNNRINDVRLDITKVLNKRSTNFIAEDVVVLLSLISEAVIIASSAELERQEGNGEA